MKRSHTIICSLILLLLFSLTAQSQSQKTELKHFAKEGLVFDYPDGWTMEENNKEDALHLILVRGSSGAQVMVIVFREPITSPEQLAAGRRALTEMLVDSMQKELQRLGARPERTTMTIDVGGAQAEGVRLRAVLNGEPGSADVYSVLLGKRLVAVTLIGSDKEQKEAAADWDTIRRSVKILDAAPPAAPDKQSTQPATQS